MFNPQEANLSELLNEFFVQASALKEELLKDESRVGVLYSCSEQAVTCLTFASRILVEEPVDEPPEKEIA